MVLRYRDGTSNTTEENNCSIFFIIQMH